MYQLNTPSICLLIAWLLFPCFVALGSSDHPLSKEEITACDLSFTTELIGVFCNEETGSVNVEISGGMEPFKIEWDNPDGSVWAEVELSERSYTINRLPAGIYKILVRDAFGCIQRQEICLKDQVSTMELAVENNSTACDLEGSISVHVGNSAPPYWVTLDGPTKRGLIVNESNFTLDGLAEGDYTVTVRQDECRQTRQIKVINSDALLSLQVEEVASCKGNFAMVTTNITGGHPNYRLYYDGPSKGYTHSNGPKIIQNLQAGQYTFTVIDQEGCTVKKEMEVGVLYHPPVLFEASSAAGICGYNGAINVSGLSGTAPYELTWRGASSSTAIIASGDAYTIDDLPSGVYELILQDQSGCTHSSLVELEESSPAVSFEAAAQAGVCGNNGSIMVSDIVGTAPYHISWTGPTGNSISTQEDTYRIDHLIAGSYNVLITDSEGCEYAQTLAISVTSAVSMASEATANFCLQNGDIWVTPYGGSGSYTLSWWGPTEGSVAIGSEGYSLAGVPPGQYKLILTDENGCESIQSIEFTIDDPYLQYSLSSTAAINNANGAFSVSFENGEAPYTISWDGPAVDYTRTNNSSAYTVNYLPPGEYWVTVTDRKGCFRESNITIGNTNGLAIEVRTTPSRCGNNGSIDATWSYGVAPYTVSWKGSSSGSILTNKTSYSVSLPAGNYITTITDANGASKSGVSNIMVQNSTLYCSLEPRKAICKSNGSLFVTINGGAPPYQLSWSGPSSGAVTVYDDYNIPNLPPGIYTTTLSDTEGCHVSESANVGIAPSNLVVTPYGGDGNIEFVFSSGSPNYTIKLTGPQNETVTASGNITITELWGGLYQSHIEDANGCETDLAIRVAGDMAPGYDSQLIGSIDNTLTRKIGERTKVDVSAPEINLGQNYPNPVSGSTMIPFELTASNEVQLLIQNSSGTIIHQVQQSFGAGNHQIRIDGEQLSTGIYYYTLVIGDKKATRRMIVLK